MATPEELLNMALSAGQQQIIKDDPYAGLQKTGIDISQLFQQAVANPTLRKGNGTRDAILGAAISGLFGGAMGSLSSNYQADRTAKYNDLLGMAIAGQDVTGNSDVTSALARTAQTQAGQTEAFQAARRAEDERNLKNDIERNIAVQAGARNPAVADSILEKLFGVKPAEPIAESPKKATGLFGGTDVTSLDDQMDAYANKLMSQGTTPNEAYSLASQRFKAIREQDGRGLKKIEDVVKSAQEGKALLDTAESYVESAGDTGGVGGYGAGLQNIAAAIFQPQKNTATKNLDSLGAKFLSLNRPVGSGATSDFEAKQYLKAGVSSANEPATNKEIIERMRYLNNLDQQYADFLDTYRGEKGTLEGADVLWSKYTRENPALIKDDKGQLVRNPSLKSWDQWLGGGVSTQATAPTQALSIGDIDNMTPEQAAQLLQQLGQ